MKKVLIITSHFAPDAHVGAKRPTKFAKFLPEYGWQAVVLTEEITAYHRIDGTMNDNLPSDLVINRVSRWRVLRFLDYQRWVDYAFSWIAPAFLNALRVLRQEKIEVVFATAPSYEAHLVGLLLKVFTGKRWVCEYRDHWIFSPEFAPKPKPIQALYQMLTKAILRNADHLVVVSQTMRELFVQLDSTCRHKFSVIYNGYDEDDFVGLNSACQGDKMTITYLGTWGKAQTPEFFLRALAELLRKRRELRKRIRVNFVGEVKWDPLLEARMSRQIEEQGLRDVIHIIPFLQHREGLSLLRTSDVLFLMVDPAHAQIGVLTAKLYEYLYTGKPILALAPPGSEIAGIIERAKAGVIVSPEDVQDIEDAIYKMWELFQGGKLTSTADPRVVAEFDRRKQTAALAEIFNNLCRSRSL